MRVSRQARAGLVDAPETHIRSMAVRGEGRCSRRLGEEDLQRHAGRFGARTLRFVTQRDLRDLIDVDGTAWAAGASNILPSAPPKGQSVGKQQSRNLEQKKENEGAASNVEVTFSFDEVLPLTGWKRELYKVNSTASSKRCASSSASSCTRSAAHPVAASPFHRPQGRIYEYRDGEAALVLVPEKRSFRSRTRAGKPDHDDEQRRGSPRSAFRRLQKSVRWPGVERFRIRPLPHRGKHIGNGRWLSRPLRQHADARCHVEQLELPALRPRQHSFAGGEIHQWKLTMPSRRGPQVDGVTIALSIATLRRRSIGDRAGTSCTYSSALLSGGSAGRRGTSDGTGSSQLDNPREKNSRKRVSGRESHDTGARTMTTATTPLYAVVPPEGERALASPAQNIDETQINFDTPSCRTDVSLRLSATDISDNPENA